MRIGIIDLGTNSVRFSVYRIKSDGHSRLIYRSKQVLCLGRDVFSTGKLRTENFELIVRTFSSFRRLSFQLGARRIIAVATSALRESANAAQLTRAVKDRTGINLRIISGLEEARIIANGITIHENEVDGLVALVDVGGGSAEISICQHHRVLHSASFPLGASRIAQELALSAKPYQRKDQRKEIAQLRTAIRARLLTVISKECWPVVPKVIGSSGTIKAVMSLCKKKKNPKIYKVKALRKLVKTLSCSSTFRPRHHRRIPAWRAETILGAAILLEEIIEALGAKRIALTRYSLTQGLLNQEILCRQLQKATEERRRSIPALPLHCQAA